MAHHHVHTTSPASINGGAPTLTCHYDKCTLGPIVRGKNDGIWVECKEEHCAANGGGGGVFLHDACLENLDRENGIYKRFKNKSKKCFACKSSTLRLTQPVPRGRPEPGTPRPAALRPAVPGSPRCSPVSGRGSPDASLAWKKDMQRLTAPCWCCSTVGHVPSRCPMKLLGLSTRLRLSDLLPPAFDHYLNIFEAEEPCGVEPPAAMFAVSGHLRGCACALMRAAYGAVMLKFDAEANATVSRALLNGAAKSFRGIAPLHRGVVLSMLPGSAVGGAEDLIWGALVQLEGWGSRGALRLVTAAVTLESLQQDPLPPKLKKYLWLKGAAMLEDQVGGGGDTRRPPGPPPPSCP